MKLHLTKGLLVALMAGFAMSGQALAATGTAGANTDMSTYINDATIDKIVVGSTMNVHFTSSGTFTGSIDIAGSGNDTKAGAIGVEGDTTAGVIDGTVTLTDNAGFIVWKEGAELEVKELDLNGKTLEINNNSWGPTGTVEILTLKEQSEGTIKVVRGTLSLQASSLAAGQNIEVGSNATLKLDSTLSNSGSLTLNGTLDVSGFDSLSSQTVAYSAGANGFKGEGTAYSLDSFVSGDGTVSGSGTVKISATESGSLNDDGSIVTEFTLADESDKTYYVNQGTVQGSSSLGDAKTVVVASGATLHFASPGDPNTRDITLNGGAMTLSNDGGDGAYQVFSGMITLADGATISGGTKHGLVSDGGSIVATGTGNEISSTISVRKDLTIEVTGKDDVLTLSGAIKANPYGTEADKAAQLKEITKTGEGTLVLGSDVSFSSAEYEGKTFTLALSIDDGTLDLSDVATLKLDSLSLAEGTTIILGENTRIEVTNALTIGSGVVFDVSSWCAYDEYDPYALFTFTGDASNLSLPENVTIHTSTGDNTQAWLEYDAENKTVMLMPEPTTTTLSLLALAGLAARRRRK